MARNRKHVRLLNERLNLISLLKFSYNKSEIKIIQEKLHKINKDIRNCVRDFNISHKPSELTSIIKELKASRIRIEGSRNKFKYGMFKLNDFTDVLIYTSDFDWLHNKSFDQKDEALEKVLKVLNYRRIGYCYFGSEVTITKKNKGWSKEISNYLEEIIKNSYVSLRIDNYNEDYYLVEFIGNSIVCNISIYISENRYPEIVYYSRNTILVNRNFEPSEMIEVLKDYGLRPKILINDKY